MILKLSLAPSTSRTGTELNIPLRRRFYYLFWRSKRSQTGKDYTGSRAFQLTDQQGTCQSPGHVETHGGWVQLLRPSRESTKNNDNQQQNIFFLVYTQHGMTHQKSLLYAVK